MAVIADVYDEVNLLVAKLVAAKLRALFFDQRFYEFFLLKLQGHNLNLILGLQDFNREILEDIMNLLAQFLGLHLTEFEVRVFVIPNDARFFFLNERTLGLILVSHH